MNLVFPRLYAILDPSLLTISELVLAETLAGSGVELIQYRNKKAPSRELFEISLRLSTALAQSGVRFIVNDRPDIALLAGAGGVHVGQDDLGVEEARAICGRQRWVGVSTHTLERLRPDFPHDNKAESRCRGRDRTPAPRAPDDAQAARRDRRNYARTRSGSLCRGGGLTCCGARFDLRRKSWRASSGISQSSGLYEAPNSGIGRGHYLEPGLVAQASACVVLIYAGYMGRRTD